MKINELQQQAVRTAGIEIVDDAELSNVTGAACHWQADTNGDGANDTFFYHASYPAHRV